MAPLTTYLVTALAAGLGAGTVWAQGSSCSDCPVVPGETLDKCGKSCYSRNIYTCDRGILQPGPRQRRPFVLEARGGANGEFNNWRVQFNDKQMLLGPTKGKAFCPNNIDRTLCGINGQESVFASPTSLYVSVSGGQNVYVGNGGSLLFTQAGTPNNKPNRQTEELTAFENAAFLGPGGAGWLACKTKDRHATYVIRSDSPEIEYPKDKTGCTSVLLLVRPYDTARGKGAYQYN